MRFAFVPALALVLAACGGSHVEPAAAPASTPAPSTSAAAKAVVPPGEAKVGDKSICLVSKDEFVITESSPKVEYEGKTYYFCCPGCDATFKADPKKYLQK